MIAKLSGTAPAGYWPVDRQTAADIIREMRTKHAECTRDYDKIVSEMDTSQDIEAICRDLWDFCRGNLVYHVEEGEQQNVSCPYTILTHRKVDCKNYALFIGGMLDALKRRGYPLTWFYRYASYDLFDITPGHVFVVVNPRTDDIWVDPVLADFNWHMPYIWHRDKKPLPAAAIGRIEGPVQIGSAESNILAQLLEYQQGLTQAVQLSQSTSTVNAITEAVVMGITTVLLPELAVALKVLQLGQAPMNNAFGVGSVGARVYGDITHFNVVGLVSDIFNGRTYQSDQYWGAAFYYYYVQGKNITNQDQVSDSMVLPAMKWFIDRTGVFISGRQHIMGLIAGQYNSFAKANTDTTTNAAMVQAATNVAQTYWKISGTPNVNYETFDPALKGSWANTVGVFDSGLTAIAAQYGETAETYAAQTGDAYASAENAGLSSTLPPWLSTILTGEIIPGIPNYVPLGVAALLIIVDLIDD